MPKKMFFNISIEKQNMILKVAMEEFTTKSFDEVSVSSIIKKAKISRGSFYTYFNNLEELFDFLFSKIREKRLYYAKELISISNNDFFVFIKKIFAYDFDIFSQKSKYSLFRNYIFHIQTSPHKSIKDMIISTLSKNVYEKETSLEEIFDFKEYNITKNEFIDLIEICMIIIINTFLKFEFENMTKEEALSLFNKRISFLEYGIRK